MIIGKENIIELYEYFYSKKYENPTYKFTPSKKADLLIDSFIKYLDNKYNLLCIGQHFIDKYFIFQFRRLEGITIKRFSSKEKAGRIQIYDILGKKAISYWEKRDIKFDYLIEPGVSHSNIDLKTVNYYEEMEKKRFYNSQKGLLNCIQRTTLYNHKSSSCILCNFKADCKKMLLSNYSNLYNLRGYNEKSQ